MPYFLMFGEPLLFTREGAPLVALFTRLIFGTWVVPVESGVEWNGAFPLKDLNLP